jgi:gamma-glutamyltranspeptidase/glutathione hydrolase
VQLETSPPNSQGFVLLEALAALEAAGVSQDRPEAMRLLLRALMLATEDREQYLGDPTRRPVPIDKLMERERLRARMVLSKPDVQDLVMRNVPAHGDTVAVCAMDSGGLAVSLIQSVFQLFGCGILEPRTGIIFHNRGRGFSLQPGAPNELVPATRPAHTLTPLVIRKDGQPVAAVGCMGGRAQPQILAQIMPGVLDRHTPLSQTLGAPRWVFGSRDIDFSAPTIGVEANAPTDWDQILRVPEFDLQRIEALSELVGHTQVIRVGKDGALEGASDPRADVNEDVVPS